MSSGCVVLLLHVSRVRDNPPVASLNPFLLGTMIRTALALAVLVYGISAFAGEDVMCSGDKQLGRAEGLWILPSFTQNLAQSRSWAGSLERFDSSAISVRVGDKGVYFNLGWHEGDAPEGNCVRLESGKLWARPAGPTGKWFGPYVRVGPVCSDESAYYLSQYFTGCFESESRERWCLSPAGISVDGKKLKTEFQIDISEGPLYGTGFRIEGGRSQFLVFVPRANGWAIYEDGWASAEGRVAVDPINGKPWRLLRR